MWGVLLVDRSNIEITWNPVTVSKYSKSVRAQHLLTDYLVCGKYKTNQVQTESVIFATAAALCSQLFKGSGKKWA